ncbi:unnamed protein product [Diabrotica balteata]|uniref:Uncharacterized protein n=1 Tax=Diabrotica balteata TaxID=107213 RepID=A0A9N9T109_DIABA|nr:unnamed protein product [Diabrotica balteata]
MDEQPSCSKRRQQYSDVDSKNEKSQTRRKMLTSEEKVVIRYEGIVSTKVASNVSQEVDICSSLAKVSGICIYRSLKNTSENKKQGRCKMRGCILSVTKTLPTLLEYSDAAHWELPKDVVVVVENNSSKHYDNPSFVASVTDGATAEPE